MESQYRLPWHVPPSLHTMYLFILYCFTCILWRASTGYHGTCLHHCTQCISSFFTASLAYYGEPVQATMARASIIAHNVSLHSLLLHLHTMESQYRLPWHVPPSLHTVYLFLLYCFTCILWRASTGYHGTCLHHCTLCISSSFTASLAYYG